MIKLKQVLVFFILTFFTVVLINKNAYCDDPNEFWSNDNIWKLVKTSDSTVTILEIDERALNNGNLIIPDTIDGLTVTAIGFGAGASVVRNEDECRGTLSIPNTVVSIGDSAFAGCYPFTSLHLGSGVKTIGGYAFTNCSGFTGTLTIPDSVTSIGYAAFQGCSGFTSLSLGTNLKTIEGWAFCHGNSRVMNFTGSLVIPNKVETIGDCAFCGCSGFTSLSLGTSLKTIGGGAFKNWNGYNDNAPDMRFAGNLMFPSSVTSIGNQAFANCSGFTGNLTIPDSVTSIGYGAFVGCSGFDGSLTISHNVNTIWREYFSRL